jgi:hypothetical protein
VVTQFDNTRSIVVQLDSKLSESWNNNFIGGYDKQIQRVARWRFIPTIDIKMDNPMHFLLQDIQGNLNFISVGLDPFTQGTSLVIQHCILRTMLQNNREAPCCLEQIMSILNQVIYFSGSNGVFILIH